MSHPGILSSGCHSKIDPKLRAIDLPKIRWATYLVEEPHQKVAHICFSERHPNPRAAVIASWTFPSVIGRPLMRIPQASSTTLAMAAGMGGMGVA